MKPLVKIELESAVEARACRMARERGWLIKKLSPAGDKTSWPDRMFLKKGVAVFIEFKRLYCKPTVKQFRRMEELENEGFAVAWFDDAVKAVAWLDKHDPRPNPPNWRRRNYFPGCEDL